MNTYSPDTDAALLEKIANGDEQAFALLFKSWYASVYNVSLALMQSPELAKEVVQDTFLKIWTDRKKLPEIKDVKAYYYIVARHRAYRLLKASVTINTLDESFIPDPVSGAEHALEARELDRLIMRGVDQLPPQQRQVFILSKQMGKKREEVAREMNISPETVKSYLAKAILQVRAWCMKNGVQPIVLLVLYGIEHKK